MWTQSALYGALIISVTHVALGAPQLAQSQQAEQNRQFGVSDTIHIYPEEVSTTDWRGVETVLTPDLKEDSIYQKFTDKQAAYVPRPFDLRLEARRAAETNTVPGEVDSTAEPISEPAAESSEASPVEIEPTPVETTPTESAATGTAVYTRATESLLTFFSAVTKFFPLTSTSTVTPVDELPPPAQSTANVVPVEVEIPTTEAALETPELETQPLSTREATTSISESPMVHTTSETEEPESVPELIATGTDSVITPLATSSQVTQPDVSSDFSVATVTSSSTTLEIATTTTPNISTLPEHFKRHTLSLSNFSIPKLKSGETITSIQLRASLAAQSKSEAGQPSPYFEISFATPSSSHTIGTVLVDDEVSNALNGGYFLFALPQNLTREDLAQAVVTVDFIGDIEQLGGAYLDALWVEVNTHRVTRADLQARTEAEVRSQLRGPSYHEVVSTNFDFARDERLVFNLKYLSQRSRAVEAVREFLGQRKIIVRQAEVLHHGSGALGIKPDITVTAEGLVTIVIPDSERPKMKPGQYTVELEIDEGGVQLFDSFDFQWGMLAINPALATAPVDAPVTISMGSLTPNGNTVCDAQLRLYHVSPSEYIETVPVSQSGKCNGNNVIDVPDYSAEIVPIESGEHELYLERLDETGAIIAHTVTSFIAEVNPALTITRTGPTRIYPPAPYAMELTVTAAEAFSGQLIERVPRDFAVYDTTANVTTDGLDTVLTWDLSMLAGTTQTVAYSFDAPDISPYLFELGPAELSSSRSRRVAATGTSSASSSAPVSGTNSNTAFVEHRQWQIASDAVGNMILLWPDGSSLPSGWRCLSCATGNWFQNFLLGSSSASTTGGSATHTHTADGSIAATAASAVSEGGAVDDISPNTHTHSYTPTIGSASNLPQFRDLRVIEYTGGAGEAPTIPAGAIGIFDTASSSLPAGWTRYAAHDGYFIRGSDVPGTTGGTNQHTHTITGTTGAGNGTAVRDRNNPPQVGVSNLTHTHTVSTTTATLPVEPPYIEVVLAELGADASAPNGLIAMWSADVGTGWDDVSSAPGSAFNNRFLKAATTYGATGGTSTHTHADETNIQTSGPTGTELANSGASGASDVHTHGATVNNFTTTNNLPPYVTVVFGKKIGTDPVYDQLSFRWYDDEGAEPPTDPWPDGATNLDEGVPIDGSTTVVKDGDQLRLRINAAVSNATSSAGALVKLQFAAADTCAVATGWTTVGDSASTTIWRGYNQSGVTDHDPLTGTVLASTTIAATFEESGHATNTPNDIGIGEVGEWDFALENNGAAAGTNYCFRLIEGGGTAFASYTTYPEVLTNSAPIAPTLSTPFDNEKTASSSLVFRFVSDDPEGETIHYQIQIDDESSFSNPLLEDDDSIVDLSNVFINVLAPAEKEPFTSGQLIRFNSGLSFTSGTTYYWRVRGRDPNGSDEWGDWSATESFTRDSLLIASAWYQTEDAQFDSNTLSGAETFGSDGVRKIAASSTGTITSSPITFADGDQGTAWESFAATESADGSNNLIYTIQYLTDSATWANIPDSDLPGNASGFASTTSLLTLDVDTYSVIRIVGTFTGAGSPVLQDWTVNWGYRVETPTISKLFANEKTGTTTPVFEFTTTDPQSDLLEYEISWSSTTDFAASTTRNSSTSAGFINLNNGGESNQFTSGDLIQFTVQPGDALTNGATYWWRVRARDSFGANAWSFWTQPQSFTVDSAVVTSTWFQTTQAQFASNILSGTIARASNTVSVATTAAEAIVVYGEGTDSAPKYRQWNGSAWGSEADLDDIGGTLRWVRVAAGTTREEYVAVTVDTNADVNAQVFSTGEWSNLQELTTNVGDFTSRGIDVVYETLSGDAMVAYCDGDTSPSYAIWDGSGWTVTAGTIGMTLSTTCEWLTLAADPTTDEIIAIARDANGDGYEARVWSGSGWANSSTFGGITEPAHEGMALLYEESGNQAIAIGSNNNQGVFNYDLWNAGWAGAVTQSIVDDFEWGQLARDVGSDEMVLCYVNDDIDVGAIQWNGTGSWVNQTILSTSAFAKTEPSFACAYEDIGSRDNHIMAVFANTAANETQYSYWNDASSSWQTAAQVDSFASFPTMQLERTGVGAILGAFFDAVNTTLYFSSWDGNAWSSAQTLEDNTSVSTTPYGHPYHIEPRNPSTEGTVVVAPGIDFDDGSGPYWESMSWNDATPGTTEILYSVQYQTATGSWEFIPNSQIPDNESGTSTSPIDLSGLNRTTYNVIRPYAMLTCDGSGNCPDIQDWTVEWAEGINVSGTLREYNQTDNAPDGTTIGVAVNGSIQTGKNDSVSGGSWSIPNVTVFPGDVVTAFVLGTSTQEAVGITRYDGSGDITGLNLYHRHVALGSNDATSTPLTNADIGLIDYQQNEDIFIGYDEVTNAVDFCGDSGCGDVRLYVNASTTYRAGGNLVTHDLVNDGTIIATTTLYVDGSWDNNASVTLTGSTVVLGATSTLETIDTTGASVFSFNNLTFGTTTGNATWTPATALDVNGNLTVSRGTLARSNTAITIAGNLITGTNGFWTGIGTTTFDGSVARTWQDQNPTLQNVGNVLIDGTNKAVTLAGNVAANNLTIGSDDTLDVSGSHYDITIYGNWINNNNFVPRNGTVTFAATTSNRHIDVGGDSFYDLTFAGAGGDWSFVESVLDVNHDFTIATGTVVLASATTTVGGSWDTSGGIFMHTNAAVEFDGAGVETIRASTSVFNNAFHDLRIDGSGSFTFLDSHSTSTGNVIVAAGTLVLPSTLFTVSGSLRDTGGTLTAASGAVRLDSAGTAFIEAGGSSLNDLIIDGSGSFTFVGTTADINGDVAIESGTVTLPAGTLLVGGSWSNTGTVNPNGGVVRFDSADGVETIDFGGSSMYDIDFNNPTGSWNITAHATTTNDVTLTAGAGFTLSPNQTLAVGGTFSNLIGGAATTWTNTTLTLVSGEYSLNTKAVTGDDYQTLRLGSTAYIKMWNSQATTTEIVSGGYLYSQDHASVDGDLYVYGEYIRTSGSEYWSYATDFDGTSLTGGSERQVDVRFQSGASASFTDVLFAVEGIAAATTTVTNQGAGTYTIDVSSGTTTLQYFDMVDLGATGLSFTDTTDVIALTNGAFTVAAPGGTALQVASTTIDANPASQFFNVDFATTTAISATNVTQTGGTSTSYWWFRNSSGNLTGEQFDADNGTNGGNPGTVRWDDSALVLTISGTIYSDDGTTPLGGDTCDNDVDTPVRVVVGNDIAQFNGDCLNDGTYSVPGVTVIGDQTLTIFLNDAPGGEVGTVVTKTATGDIADLDIYTNRVITRHEDVFAMSIADMAVYDRTQDDDIAYTAATGTITDTLDVAFDTELHIWDSTTFTPGGPVTINANATANTYDGSLHIGENATFTGAGTTTYTIGGSLSLETGASYVPASTTIVMNASSSKAITVAAEETLTVHEMQFTGASGDWTWTGNATATADIQVAAGTLMGTPNLQLVNGSLYGNGLVSFGGGQVYLEQTNTLGGTQGWTFNDLVLGNSFDTGTTTPGSTATTTVGGTLTIAMAHYLDAGASAWDLSGSGTVFVENGTFLYDTSSVTYSGVGATTILSTDYFNLHFNAVGGSPTYTATGLGVQAFGDVTIGGTSDTVVTFENGGTDPAFNVDGNFTIYNNGTFIASNNNGFTIAGNYTNDGSFTANSGTVTFDGTGSSDIYAGNSNFATVDITGTGDFTVREHATSITAFTIGASATSFTLDAGQTLQVVGTFTNNLGGLATDWTGSILHLSGGGNYTINASTTPGDSYETLQIGTLTHIRSWNSDANSILTAVDASLYSQDHAEQIGDLYIYGDYSKSSGTDYWSYTTDFDGTDISGSPRLVEVFIEGGGSVLYNGTAGLSVLGISTASTTITNQGSGVYAMTVAGDSVLNMNYYSFADLDADGLTLDDSPSITDLSYGHFLVGNNNDVAITVDGSVISDNPALTFTNNRFATSSGVSSAINVRATSSASSGWQFTNHTGDIDGEDFDDDPGPSGGNPGYIGWDNSSSSITISGTVYQANRSTASGVCAPGVYNITMVINTNTATSTDCTAGGFYQFGPISFADNASVVVFIDNETADATTVTYDPVTSVGNLDLYEGHLIIRHEGAAPITSTVLDDYDAADDNNNDVLYLVSGSDLTVATDTALVVWTNKTFAPGGDVTIPSDGGGPSYDGTLELFSGATYTTAAGQVHTIGGSLISATGATYTASTATTTFTTTESGRTIDINDGNFYNVAFTGSGSWTIADTTFNVTSVAQSAGTLTLPTGTTTVSGYWNTSGGTITNNGSLMLFDATTAGNQIAFGGSAVAGLQFTGSGSWNMTDTNATSSGSVIIADGTLTLPSGTLSVGGSFRNTGGAFTHNSGELILSTSTTATLLASSSDLYAVTFRGGADYTIEDASLALLDTLSIENATVTLTTNVLGSTLSIGGSLLAGSGVFDSATGTIQFNSDDTGETIDPGESSFYNLLFANSAGGWTIVSDATTTRNFVLSTASDFTLQSGSTLYVGNVFDNSVGGAATTWTGSTLILDLGTTYEINSKLDTGDDYETLIIGANTDISSWFSQATTTIVDSSSSWYSQDNGNSDGELYIYGDYQIGTTTEYWSYATDFDGTAPGVNRAVSVYLADGATTTLAGGTLEIVGTAGNQTLITNQGAGTYSVVVTDGTFNAQYYQFRNLGANGLSLSGTPTILSLNYGDFELAVDGGRLIDLASTTLNANASLVITGARFATTSAIAGTNVYLTGETESAWTFTSHTGNLDGEDFDVDGITACGQVRWNDSSCQLLQQTHYRWRNDNGGLGVPTTEWLDTDWDKRKSVRIDNPNSTTTNNAVIELTINYDADMQSDFGDLRFTDASGTTTIPYFIASSTSGIAAEIWVQVPSLTLTDTSIVYMYYDYISATTTTGSSTQTFIAADDFEDGGIAEYSGAGDDKSLFTAQATAAYGNSAYRLDNTGETGNITDDGGMARFDQTINQGQTIRYMQYIDTTNGNNEVCTLFGVQSPVSNNQNYGVCMEQIAGTDFMAIVENVTYAAVPSVQRASTTLTFVEGWYEVEIDWGTDDSIFVSLYDDQENLVATTSVSDISYSSGGYGFAYWVNEGAWDNIFVRPTLTIEPTVRYGAEVSYAGASWAAAQDTAVIAAAGGNVRVRFAIENSGLATTTSYTLEYADKGVAPSCEAVSSVHYDPVPLVASCGGEALCITNSSNYTNGDSTADLLFGTEGTFVNGQAVDNTSNATGNLTLATDEYTELEYTIAPNVSASSTNYCVRVTGANGDLDTYLSVAELEIRFDPSLGIVYFDDRDGYPGINLLGGTTTRVYATTTVSDANGTADLRYATATMYSTTAGAACSENPNNCYIPSNSSSTAAQCSFTNCAGNSCVLECYADFAYHTDPEEWYAFVEVEDSQGGVDFDTSMFVDVNELSYIASQNAIGYGAVNAATSTGQFTDTGSYNPTTTIQNIGNIALDISLVGTDLTDGGSSVIEVDNQLFATSSFTYSSCGLGICTPLSTTTISNYELDLVKPTTTAAAVQDVIYWGIQVPFGVKSNPHSGLNTFFPAPD